MPTTAREATRTQPGVYLAARFARREELLGYAAELEAAGLRVTARWLYGDASLSSSELADPVRAAALAVMDLEDVRSADVCVAFSEPEGHPAPGRGGRHTELGVALGCGVRVLLVGPREQVFHCLPQVEHFDSWTQARDALEALVPRLAAA